jgi:hypothetical protein
VHQQLRQPAIVRCAGIAIKSIEWLVDESRRFSKDEYYTGRSRHSLIRSINSLSVAVNLWMSTAKKFAQNEYVVEYA